MTCRKKQKAIRNKLLCLPYTNFFTRNEHLTQKWTTQSFLKELLTRTRHKNSWTPNTTNRWQLHLKSQPACVRSLETRIENLNIYCYYRLFAPMFVPFKFRMIPLSLVLNHVWYLCTWSMTIQPQIMTKLNKDPLNCI